MSTSPNPSQSLNPIAAYMADNDIGTVQMAALLKVSKGYVSHLKSGEKPVSLLIARRMAALTGRPVDDFISAEEAA